jgi:GTPase SAR1 family protein
VLRARVRTSGIIETNFVLEQFHFSIIDVGGQRSERRKWIHCFQDVTAVLYCVALSGYDQKLFEDETVNRMHEALQLFKDIVNGEWFANTAMILFLNKRDLFEKKVQTVPLTVCFEDYRGDNSFEDAWRFMEKKFLELNNDKNRQIYTHLTCATDTDNIKFVFNAVKTIVLKTILNELELYGS